VTDAQPDEAHSVPGTHGGIADAANGRPPLIADGGGGDGDGDGFGDGGAPPPHQRQRRTVCGDAEHPAHKRRHAQAL